MPAKKTQKPVTDIERPGTQPASATSRPIITNRGPAIKDPMVFTEPETKQDDAEKLPPSATKKSIQPSVQVQDEASHGPVSSAAEENTVNTDFQGENVPEKTVNTEAQDEKRAKELDTLISNKTYFVPIGAVNKRRNTRSLELFIAFILVIVGLLLAIDAGLLLPNIQLPFDLL